MPAVSPEKLTVTWLFVKLELPRAPLAVAAAVVGGIAWSGHGATGPAPLWHRAADVLHLLIGAVWPTGLLPLAVMLVGLRRIRLRRSLREARRRRTALPC